MKFAVTVFSIFSASVFASSFSFVAAVPNQKAKAVAVEKEADYAAIAVEIQCSQKDPAEQIKEIQEIQNLVIAKAGELKDIEVVQGPISLSARPIKNAWDYSSAALDFYRPESSAQLTILSRLDEKTDLYHCAVRIKAFLGSIKLPSKVKFELSPIQLAVKDPEQYRQAILKKIGEDVQFVKTALGHNGKITFSGLEQPVFVRQVNDRNVELFINYTMTIELPESR